MAHDFRLIESGWDQVLAQAAQGEHPSLRVVCPFLKKSTIQRLLTAGKPGSIQVITRFNLDEFREGVSDTSALRLLLKHGAQVRGVKHVHAKLYLFGNTRVVVTSANLTEAAMLRNHEFGFIADQPLVVRRCGEYFNDLWCRSAPDLILDRLEEWEERIEAAQIADLKRARPPRLGDEGVDIGLPGPSVVTTPAVAAASQAFVKFLGESGNREVRTLKVLEEVKRSGCHWACAYPEGKRPRQVQPGAVMYLGRMMKQPDDILIFGRALAMAHVPGRDDATDADKKQRSWKAKWPHYIRLRDPEFLAGTLGNGVSLNALMDTLEARSFASTLRNELKGSGNTDPRKAYRQKPAVELTPDGVAWLNDELERAFTRHGKLGPAQLDRLDWPDIPPQQ